MIMDMYDGVKIAPEDVLGEFTAEEVAEALVEENVNMYTKEQAMEVVEEALDGDQEHDEWLFPATWYAHTHLKEDLDYKDRMSFASLLTSVVTGWYGGYGTEMYRKERKIEDKCLYLLNRLVENDTSALAAAKMIKTFMEDQYKNMDLEGEKNG